MVTFTLLKGLVWGVTIPAFWAGDEDYHFLYVESLTTQQQLPARDRPLYPPEYSAATRAIQYDTYGQGPRSVFEGDAKRTVKELGDLPESAREPTEFGRGVGVVHPPLYPVTGALVNASMGDASILTRLTVVRFVSAALGAIAVYFTWLLAAQMLTRFLHQFMAAFFMAVQPTFSYMSGVVNHDVALAAFFGAALTMMLFLMRTPPRAMQGAWLGAAIALAMLVKATALVLISLAGLAYLGQALVHRAQWREVARSSGLMAATILIFAAWWYVYAKIAYGSFTGVTTGVTTPGGGAISGDSGVFARGPGELLSWTREWIALTYRTYWWHFLFWEAPGQQSWWFYVPFAGGILGMAGLVRVAWIRRTTLLDANDPLLRQVVLLVVAALAILVPFLGVDLVRRADGLGFFANSGRYLIPAFGGVAALFIVGIRGLVGERVWTPAAVTAAAVAAAFNLRVYDFHYVNRYFGHESIGELLRRLSFDRPEFVTPMTIAVTMGLAAGLALAAWIFALRSERIAFGRR